MKSKNTAKSRSRGSKASAKASFVGLLALFAGSLAAHAQLINYNFDNLNSGDLVGQDGWKTAATSTFNDATVGAETVALDTTLGLIGANSGSAHVTAAAVRNFGLFGLTGTENLTLSFEFVATSTTSDGLFGIGSNTSPADFGVFGGVFYVRAEGNGTAYTAYNSSGVAMAPTLGDLYSIESVWNLSANGGQGSASLYIMDLTAGATSYTELFFNTAQTTATVNLGFTSDEETAWNTAFVRTGNATSGGDVDDLVVTAAPEPSVWALFTFVGCLGICGTCLKKGGGKPGKSAIASL